jgi:hypothetical protein
MAEARLKLKGKFVKYISVAEWKVENFKITRHGDDFFIAAAPPSQRHEHGRVHINGYK